MILFLLEGVIVKKKVSSERNVGEDKEKQESLHTAYGVKWNCHLGKLFISSTKT